MADEVINNIEKKQNILAVFEHIECKEKKRSKIPAHKRSVVKGLSIQDSDNELSQEEDDPMPKRKRTQGVRFLEEPLKLRCLWQQCGSIFEDYHLFIKHIFNHCDDVEIEESYVCFWDSCGTNFSSLLSLRQHIIYHGHLARLINIGHNVLGRVSLPKCLFNNQFKIPEKYGGYKCEWETCDMIYNTIYEFYEHIRGHIKANPKYCKNGDSIPCLWKGCTVKFPSQYKLMDHVRLHSKEKVIACPTCLVMFSTKTKFNDHRKRQLPIDLQSYQCSQCSKLFPSERLLRDHMRSHINLYKCTMCDMTCAKPSALKTHIRYRHLSERPLQCNLCDYGCLSKQSLEAHILTHFPEKSMACEECDYRCRSSTALNRHYRVIHGSGVSRTYECHCCNKRFHIGNRLTNHLMKRHNFQWPSGHSRFRYKEDPDGIFRLQTVRYESIEVTREMIRTNNPESVVDNMTDQKNPDEKPLKKYVLMFAENGETNVVCPTENTIMLSINDMDAQGNVVNSQIMQSNEMKVMIKSELI